MSQKGIHHITVLGGDGQRTTDFYVHTLGLRLIMKTVNQDDPYTYHLFFVNGTQQLGSSLTFFPWPMAGQGKPAIGEATTVSFAVPSDSMEYWAEHFGENGVDFTGPFERFGKQVIGFRDPDRLHLELVFDDAVKEVPAWSQSTVPVEHGIRGFWGTIMELTETEADAELLKEVFGFRQEQVDQNHIHLVGDAPVGNSVILKKTESLRGATGRGTIHHVAFRAANETELISLREKVLQRGLEPTEVINRHFFKSVYFRTPGGVLFEIATDGPGYSGVQNENELGKTIWLPDDLEPNRDMIEKRLPEIKV